MAPPANPDHLDLNQAKRLAGALQANAEKLFQLVLETDFELIKTLLHNPNLTDDHLQALLKRRDLPEELLRLIYRHRQQNLSHKLMLALVKNPATPGSLVRNLMPNLRLFELVDLCFMPGVTPDQKVVAERAILVRLPTTPLGNKITLARRASAAIVAALLKEGDSRTTEACLNNPRLKEAAVFQFINSPAATATTISVVARHSRWKQRPNLQLAILGNRQTPAVWYTLWLPKLPPFALNRLASSRRLSLQQKELVKTELKRREGR